MLYFKVQYSDGLFCGGVAYLRAFSREGAKRQCKRACDVTFDLRTLRQISKATYQSAQKKAGR